MKQVFRRHTRCPDGIKELTAFAEDTFHINIDFVFSIIINIGDIESVLPKEIENRLGSYLTALQPVVTADMLHSSKRMPMNIWNMRKTPMCTGYSIKYAYKERRALGPSFFMTVDGLIL